MLFYQPYRHYLDFLDKIPKHTKLKKSAFIFVSISLIAFGTLSALFFWHNQTTKPLIIENQYLENSTAGFLATSQSLNEVIANFQIQGAKVKVVDELKESSSASSAFFVPMEDLTKIISNLESVKKHILFQKNQLSDQNVPQKFVGLSRDLMDFYDESLQLLDALHTQQMITKEFLVSLGPNFYLPVLTNESLWEVGKIEDITNYYQKIKAEANQALANVAHLDVPQEFKKYYDTQIAYLELLVNTSTQISEILSESNDEQNQENATQIEKAYQILIGAKRQNEVISEELLKQRLSLLSKETNFAKFAPVKIKQNSIEIKLSDFHDSQSQVQESIFLNIIDNIQNFFQKYF